MQETKELLIKGVLNSASDTLMHFIYDHDLPLVCKTLNQQIVKQSCDLGKSFLECFRKEPNREIVEKLMNDDDFRNSNPLIKKLFG